MEKNYITQVIDLLRKDNYYGAGNLVEIAKGKHQLATNFKIGLRKIKRKYYENGN
jgi:hypothetical protein